MDKIDWIALMIGNSRLHWGFFHEGCLKTRLDTPHLCRPLSIDDLEKILAISLTKDPEYVLPLVVASVVPGQMRWCRHYAPVREIGLADIPLQGLYPTLGIDRALALWGAGQKYGFPCLVIDGGTALTCSAVDGQGRFVGGAILPGLRVQFQSLVDRTAALPLVSLPDTLPPLWGRDTRTALESGIIQTIVAGIERFIRQWSIEYPHGAILFTGGDAERLEGYWQTGNPDTPVPITRDESLIFEGMSALARF